MSGIAPDAPTERIPILVIHHSCGGQLLAERGPEKERAACILDSHPNGGGLRVALQGAGYDVREASYGSDVGENTDLFDWLPKFRTKMEKMLRVAENDAEIPEGAPKSRVVVFKSCFPNNAFVSEGQAPGDPAGPELTAWNARATMTALLAEFAKHPDVLFVYVTAPPLAPVAEPVPAYRLLASLVRGKGTPVARLERSGKIARAFNEWILARDGWLKDYAPKNVVAFDYYGALTAGEAHGLSSYPTGDGRDSHPSSEGNAAAARPFVPFLHRAVRRAGLLERPTSPTP